MAADPRDPPTRIAGYDPIATAEGGDWWDPAAAQVKVEFFERLLTHGKGRFANKPFVLEPWQRDWVRTLFGWKRADGTRRYRRSLLFIPRKNGKTQLAAGVALACLFNDGETGAECYCTGYNRDQAGILFDAASYSVEKNRCLRRVSKVVGGHKRITYRDRNSFLRALPANVAGGHGSSTHFVAYDEFHLYTSPRHVELYNSLHTSTLYREQPLELFPTTAGFDQTSLCYELYEEGCAVRDGRLAEPTLLPLIYEKPAGLEWTDPAAWAAANPNLDVTVPRDYLTREVDKARRNPSLENTVRRLHLNEWTSQESRWIPMEAWRECWGTPGPPPRAEPAVLGLDLSSTTDLTAAVLVQRLPPSPAGAGYRVHGHYWAPMRRVQAMRERGLPVDRWVRDGWLTPMPGAAIELAPIEEWIVGQGATRNLLGVGYDPWNAEALRQGLEKRGVVPVKVPQGVGSLSSACRELERAVLAERLDHSGDPVLAWCAENVQVISDTNGNIRPAKPPHGSEKKIDAVSALVTGLTLLLATPAPRPSAYSTPGSLML